MDHMIFEIKSRKLGRTITFSRPVGTNYIFADLNGNSGTMGKQICKGGYTMGSTLTYRGGDKNEFKNICKNWFKSYIRKDF